MDGVKPHADEYLLYSTIAEGLLLTARLRVRGASIGPEKSLGSQLMYAIPPGGSWFTVAGVVRKRAPIGLMAWQSVSTRSQSTSKGLTNLKLIG